MSEHLGSRPPGISLLATAEDMQEAGEWEAVLLMARIHCVKRDRPDGGVDVFVPATSVDRARKIMIAAVSGHPDSGGFFANVGWMLMLVLGVGIAIAYILVFN